MGTKKDKKSQYLYFLLALGAFALILHFGTTGALAADTDLDGFANESTPLVLSQYGFSMNATDNVIFTSLPLCAGTETGAAREKCVDPATKDLFVIIQRASSGTNIPSPPYYPTATPTNPPDPLGLARTGGFGVTIHELTQTSGTSQLIGDYYAVKVIEDLTLTGTYLGFSTFGTFAAPYSGGVATVWTNKIIAAIDKACGKSAPIIINNASYSPSTNTGTFYCKNANSTTSINMKDNDCNPDLTKLYNEYIQNIASHEVSHMIHLASATGTVDHHYTTISGVLMEQAITAQQTVSKSGNVVVTLYISTGYTRDDKRQFWLKAQ